MSSTDLVRLRAKARANAPSAQPAPLARANGRAPYAVSLGADEVDAAARRLVDRNPRRGTFRLVQVLVSDAAVGAGEGAPGYLHGLADRVMESPETLLYQIRVPGSRGRGERLGSAVDRATALNVRRRVSFTNPLAMDVLIGEHEALIALPDRGGTRHLGACLVVDDPDFVAALRQWYDEWIWDPPAGSSGGVPDIATPVFT